MATKQQQEDVYAQMAGAIGTLAVAFGAVGAVKAKLGISWPAAVALSAGALILLGYLAWRIRTFLTQRGADARSAGSPRSGRTPQKAASEVVSASVVSASTQGQGPADEGSAQLVTSLVQGSTQQPTESEPPAADNALTTVLRRVGAIDGEEIIRADESKAVPIPGIGTVYDFLVPPRRTHEDVAKRLRGIASMYGVTRLHMSLETSRQNERHVKLLKLDDPPFTRPFPSPSRQEIETFTGIPLGHDVTGKLVGVPTFDNASMLVAGMTQMGKTALVNGLITCLLIAYDDFDLYLLDGKFCGLTRFEPIAKRYESSDDPAVFWSMVDELNDLSARRYAEIKRAIRDRKPRPQFKPVFFIVDEAADFFASGGTSEEKDRAKQIVDDTRKLVSKSLESGISTVLMTQRPSANAIPVEVRDQFLYRVCMYVASSGTAKVALGDTYFETVAPINPALLDPKIPGQAVLFVRGHSTLIRGFDFPDKFIWDIVDEMTTAHVEDLPEGTPLRKAIDVMRSKGVDFMSTSDLATALDIWDDDAAKRGKKLQAALGGPQRNTARGAQGRGYHLEDLIAHARSNP